MAARRGRLALRNLVLAAALALAFAGARSRRGLRNRDQPPCGRTRRPPRPTRPSPPLAPLPAAAARAQDAAAPDPAAAARRASLQALAAALPQATAGDGIKLELSSLDDETLGKLARVRGRQQKARAARRRGRGLGRSAGAGAGAARRVTRGGSCVTAACRRSPEPHAGLGGGAAPPLPPPSPPAPAPAPAPHPAQALQSMGDASVATIIEAIRSAQFRHKAALQAVLGRMPALGESRCARPHARGVV